MIGGEKLPFLQTGSSVGASAYGDRLSRFDGDGVGSGGTPKDSEEFEGVEQLLPEPDESLNVSGEASEDEFCWNPSCWLKRSGLGCMHGGTFRWSAELLTSTSPPTMSSFAKPYNKIF